MSDYIYYIVESNETKKAIANVIGDVLLSQKKISEFSKKYGESSENYISVRGIVTGIDIKSPPDDWVEVVPGYYRPHAKKKSCLEARESFENIPRIPDNDDLAKAINVESYTEVGCKVLRPGVEEINGSVILSIPVGAGEPEGCREIFVSEYFKMKENESV